MKGVSLSIAKGEFVALVGPSGAGKSTLLHILGGLDIPTQGKVLLDGKDLYGHDDRQLSGIRRKRIGFVFQFYHLLQEFTALENVMMPALIAPRADPFACRQKAQTLLALAGLSQRSSHFPSELSGGEKQRVAVVRALMNEPELLLCDEPTGNLDSQTGEEIMALIKGIAARQQMTTLVVTHNQELARRADKVYSLRDGVASQ